MKNRNLPNVTHATIYEKWRTDAKKYGMVFILEILFALNRDLFRRNPYYMTVAPFTDGVPHAFML
ncbi:MAG TPA: hypothetical protein DDY37_07780 [Legionella sp.]|nr:hypothetical protein [Legionella sp.]